jgi:hypothetical protein
MRFHETREGDYRIFVGALEAARGGWTAALVVSRDRGPARHELAFRDDSLSCGYRWPTSEEAMQYAILRGREMVRSRSPMLTC